MFDSSGSLSFLRPHAWQVMGSLCKNNFLRCAILCSNSHYSYLALTILVILFLFLLLEQQSVFLFVSRTFSLFFYAPVFQAIICPFVPEGRKKSFVLAFPVSHIFHNIFHIFHGYSNKMLFHLHSLN